MEDGSRLQGSFSCGQSLWELLANFPQIRCVYVHVQQLCVIYENLSMVCVCERHRPALLDNMLSSHHSSAEAEAFPHIITPLSNTHTQLLLSSSSCEVPGARVSVQSSSHLYYMTSLHILILVHFREMNISSTPVVRALGMLWRRGGKLWFSPSRRTIVKHLRFSCFLHGIVHTWFTHADSVPLHRMRFCCKITEPISLDKKESLLGFVLPQLKQIKIIHPGF